MITIAGGIILAVLILRFWRGVVWLAIITIGLGGYLTYGRWERSIPGWATWCIGIGIVMMFVRTDSVHEWRKWHAEQIGQSSTLKWWRRRHP